MASELEELVVNNNQKFTYQGSQTSLTQGSQAQGSQGKVSDATKRDKRTSEVDENLETCPNFIIEDKQKLNLNLQVLGDISMTNWKLNEIKFLADNNILPGNEKNFAVENFDFLNQGIFDHNTLCHSPCILNFIYNILDSLEQDIELPYHLDCILHEILLQCRYTYQPATLTNSIRNFYKESFQVHFFASSGSRQFYFQHLFSSLTNHVNNINKMINKTKQKSNSKITRVSRL